MSDAIKQLIENDYGPEMTLREAELQAENERLTAELDEARAQWSVFAGMMEPLDECMCLDPPDLGEEDPSSHNQYCPVYLQAYALAMANGTELPE